MADCQPGTSTSVDERSDFDKLLEERRRRWEEYYRRLAESLKRYAEELQRREDEEFRRLDEEFRRLYAPPPPKGLIAPKWVKQAWNDYKSVNKNIYATFHEYLKHLIDRTEKNSILPVEERLKIVRETLRENNDILSDNLIPDDILRSMKTKCALEPDEVTKIKQESTTTEQVDKLIDILRKKPESSYIIFMDLLKVQRQDLYKEVKATEERKVDSAIQKYTNMEEVEEIIPTNEDSPKRKYARVEEEEAILPTEDQTKHTKRENQKKQRKKRKTRKQRNKSKCSASTYTILLDEDVDDILNLLDKTEMGHLFDELNITSEEQDAIKEISRNLDEKDEARATLGYWRRINGSNATREKIVDALEANENTQYAATKVKKKWNMLQDEMKADVTSNLAISSAANQAKNKKQITATGRHLANAILKNEDIEDIVNVLEHIELKTLLKTLDIAKHMGIALKQRFENLEYKDRARILLKFWRKTNGITATKEKIIQTLENNKYTLYAAIQLLQKWNMCHEETKA